MQKSGNLWRNADVSPTPQRQGPSSSSSEHIAVLLDFAPSLVRVLLDLCAYVELTSMPQISCFLFFLFMSWDFVVYTPSYINRFIYSLVSYLDESGISIYILRYRVVSS